MSYGDHICLIYITRAFSQLMYPFQRSKKKTKTLRLDDIECYHWFGRPASLCIEASEKEVEKRKTKFLLLSPTWKPHFFSLSSLSPFFFQKNAISTNSFELSYIKAGIDR